MMRVIGLALCLFLLPMARVAAADPPDTPAISGEAGSYGQDLYSAWCSNCHGAAGARDSYAPTLTGLFGRRPASVPGFSYSPMITQLDFVWSATTLDAWLEGLSTESPTTSIRHLGIANERDHSAIVAYIGTLN
jgi:cytochrome c